MQRITDWYFGNFIKNLIVNNMSKRILVVGGDGFCGWPTSLGLAASGHSVMVVDDLSRRKIDEDLETESLTPISTLDERVKRAKADIGDVNYEIFNVATDSDALLFAVFPSLGRNDNASFTINNEVFHGAIHFAPEVNHWDQVLGMFAFY